MNNTITGLGTTLASAVNTVQKGIVEVQEQLAAGKAKLNPAENGVVTRLNAQIRGYESVTRNITDATSVISVAQTALTSIAEILVQMKGLAVQAASTGFASTDRDSLNKTFQNLTQQVSNLVTNASVNGNNLIDTDSGLDVTTGIDGTSDSQTTVAATNVNDLVTALEELLITGQQVVTDTFDANELATPVSTVTTSADSTDVTTTISTTGRAAVLQQDTVTFGALTSGDTLILGGYTLEATADMSASEVKAAFIAKQSVTADSSGTGYTWTNAGGSIALSTLYTVASGTGDTATFTKLTAAAGSTPVTKAGTGTGISGTAVANTTVGYVAAAQVETLTFSLMKAGDSFAAGGLILSATSDMTAAQVATAFYDKISSSTATSIYGTWSGTKDSDLGTATLNSPSIAWTYAATGVIATSQIDASITSGEQIQTITLPTSNLNQGNTIKIGNIIFTAGSAGASPSEVCTAFSDYINNAVEPDASIGKFTTTTTAVTQVEKVSFVAIQSGDIVSCGGLSFSALSSMTAAQVASAFLAKITNSAVTSTYGTWTDSEKSVGLGTAVASGGSTSAIDWSYTDSGVKSSTLVNGASTVTLQIANGGSGTATDLVTSVKTAGINANTGTKLTSSTASVTVTSTNTFTLTTSEPLTSSISSTGNDYQRNALTFDDHDLLSGDSITIDGLTFTANQTTTRQQVIDAFMNVINFADVGNNYGTFTNTDLDSSYLSEKVAYFTSNYTATDLGNGVLLLDNTEVNTITLAPEISSDTRNSAVTNANLATQVITAKIATISTAQSSLSAAQSGLDAQLTNTNALNNGIQKTVGAIQNIDPTRLQAKLQELNTQQSVDYYLVSQMNTAAAAILSIFR
jgi:flagellin-like hook-associated protein FlgL